MSFVNLELDRDTKHPLRKSYEKSKKFAMTVISTWKIIWNLKNTELYNEIYKQNAYKACLGC